MLNPITRGYDAIFAALSGWAPLTAIVRVGNFVDVTTPEGAEKFRAGFSSPGDRARVVVTERRFDPSTFTANSLGVRFVVTYPVLLKSGQASVNAINQIMWECVRALTHAGPQFGMPDIAEGWKAAGEAVPLDPDSKRKEWSATLLVTVTFSMTRQQYLAATFT